jgi:PAS domain S-box-containing protein
MGGCPAVGWSSKEPVSTLLAPILDAGRRLLTWRWFGAALFLAVFVARLLDPDAIAAWDMLYVIPTLLVARLGGLAGGVATGAVATALIAVWAQIKGVHLGVEGYAIRAATLLFVGATSASRLRRVSPPPGPPAELKERRDTALKLAVVGTWELDVGSDEMRWSKEYHDLYGVDPEAFPSSRAAFEEIVHPDDRAVLEKAIDSIVADGVAVEARYRIRRPSDGAERCIRSHIHCERDASGRPTVVFGSGQDVTDLVTVLSPRERELLMLLAEGLSGEQIAERFTLSPATVRTHINNAMTKLGAHTRGQAIAIALRSDEIGS